MSKEVKYQLDKRELYTPILNTLKTTTNLTEISNKLSISKQNLNIYLRNLKNKGYVIHKGKGWWELTEKSKISTNYGELLPKDFIRGHAYVWTIKLPKEIKGWDKRIEILNSKGINYNLVGVLKDIPRIKVLNRKVWLCKYHLRIFDNKKSSYYGENSTEARKRALNELFLIVGALENKLGILLKPLELEWAKEHYALIKNDLAIDQNRKGIIWRISDESGEWLLIDDSLEEGGELENVGKKSFQVNPKMQRWWNEQKETNFGVTPKFTMEAINKLTSAIAETGTQLLEYRKENKGHLELINLYKKESSEMFKLVSQWRKSQEDWRKHKVKEIKKDLKEGSQTSLKEFI